MNEKHTSQVLRFGYKFRAECGEKLHRFQYPFLKEGPPTIKKVFMTTAAEYYVLGEHFLARFNYLSEAESEPEEEEDERGRFLGCLSFFFLSLADL